MAERVGFEPTRRVNAWRFSRPLPSSRTPSSTFDGSGGARQPWVDPLGLTKASSHLDDKHA